jgi:uncharacterized flavoprotein (TIGR03862 family)
MAAEVLARSGVPVYLYDAKPSAGRKLLVAGKGGLNLTHSESFSRFVLRYRDRSPQLEPILRLFGPDQVRLWAADLGVETFVGTSGRVFPVGMRSYPLLSSWLSRLRDLGVVFNFRHRWAGWSEDGSLRFDTPSGMLSIRPRAVILAMGGASWPVTGSDGSWVPFLIDKGVPVSPLKPSNCGFEVAWSDHFREKYNGHPVKSVVLSYKNTGDDIFHRQGEFIITRTGLEGSLIYACSTLLRDALAERGKDIHKKVVIHLDLAPAWTQSRLVERLSRPRGSRSMASHLEKSVGLKGVKAGLLREFLSKSDLSDPEILAKNIKDLSIPLLAPRPIEEAISTAGGVPFEALDPNLMIRALPGVFCAGEMLDWEAPTGGYLLTACLATARTAASGVISYLAQ